MVAKTEKKDEKTSLGNKILDYVPWRTALTVAAFAIPVAGPIVGAVVGILAYGNYKKNNQTENSASKSNNRPNESNNEESGKENEKESAQPGRLKKFLSKAGTIAIRIGVIAIGFLLGGPIGGAIAIGLMAIDGISGGKLIQGAEKVLDAGYDVLDWAKDKTLGTGKWAVDKIINSRKEVEEKEGKPNVTSENGQIEKEEKKDGLMRGFNNPCYSPDVGNTTEKGDFSTSHSKPIIGEQTAKLAQNRGNSANQEQMLQ
ncbi:hypothetical protein [Candidatus Wolbachia massiliensis]|uniref:Uncharacterized protein n=1 Tax=Candidatus Wolbachia massiliensis TaxID=1845000 RepID=A0A7M3U1X6_9RICK|nr:hypothetical protein [Candidatus Wolbachia massiliensis]QOD38411.1 hypothetical protein ID128_00620 [Candidatus Wolbachia massiliensis]